MDNTKLLSVSEVAQYLNIAKITVRRLIKTKKLGYKKIGSRQLVSPSQIQAYLDSVDVKPVIETQEAK